MRFRLVLLVVLGVTSSPRAQDGLRWRSEDGSLALRFGARVDVDFAAISAPAEVEARAGPAPTTFELRRARLRLRGTVDESWAFDLMYDVDPSQVELKKALLAFQGLPGNSVLQAGYFTEPYGLERNTSTRHITFMERSLTDSLAPGRNTGLMWSNTFEELRATWSIGIFSTSDSGGQGVEDRHANLSTRLTAVPLQADDAHLLHIGVGWSHRRFPGDIARFRQRPETHASPFFVDTGPFAAERADFVHGEAAWIAGSFSLQAEASHAGLDLPGGGVVALWAGFVQASYFLTGEHRVYRSSGASFGRIEPRGPGGAWEIAARLAHLDLDDRSIAGGRLTDSMLGLNWHAKRNIRVQLNVIVADLHGFDPSVIVQTRVQLDF